MMNGYNTYIGILVAFAPTFAGWFGITLSPLFGEQFTALAADVITALGTLYALYGRARATVPGWLARRSQQ